VTKYSLASKHNAIARIPLNSQNAYKMETSTLAHNQYQSYQYEHIAN